MSANAREQKTIATTNTDGMVVFSLQDLNADVLGQVAGSSRAGSGAAGEKEKFRYQPNNNTTSNATTRNDDGSGHPGNKMAMAMMMADGDQSDEENSPGGGGKSGKKPSRNSAAYRPGPGRRSNNLRPHPTRYRPPFLRNGNGGGSGGGGWSPTNTANVANSSSSSSVSRSVAKTTKRAPPPIKTAIRFEEETNTNGGSVIANAATATPTPNPASTSTSTMMSSGRRSNGGSPPAQSAASRHPDVHDGNVYGAITFASTPDDREEAGSGIGSGGGSGGAEGGTGRSRVARFAAQYAMSGGSRGRGAGGATARQKQQYRKTPHWKTKAATGGSTTTTSSSTSAANAPATDASKAKAKANTGDHDYETGFVTTNGNDDAKNDPWYSPFSSPAPTSQYDYEHEEYHHHIPQAPPTDDDKGRATSPMPSAALTYVNSTRAEVASLTSPNVRALNAMARPWEGGRIRSPSSSVAASAAASATPLSTGGASYGSSVTNDFQVLSPKSDLTSNATKTPSTGGTSTGTRGSGGGSAASATSRSSFASPTTQQLASWASGASPTSPSVASVLDKSLLSAGSALPESVAAAATAGGGSTRSSASSAGRVVRRPGGGGFNVVSSPGDGATVVQSAGGSIGIGDVSHYLLSSVSVDIASPAALDKTDAAICFGSGGSIRGTSILSPTTTIASEDDAFTPSLRAEESGSENTGTVTSPNADVIKTAGRSKVDASTLTIGATPSVPKMVEARTQTEDVAGQAVMKIGETPKSQGQDQDQAKKSSTMSATATVFTPTSKMSVSATALARSSTRSTASVGQRQYQKQQTQQTHPGTYSNRHAYAQAPTASSTPAPVLSAKMQLAYIPTEINGIIHYVPTHVVLPAESPYSCTQHYPIQTAMGSATGASIAAESAAAAARLRKPCRITSPASNNARAKTMTMMNALAREFEPSPKK